ncbi:MAG: hypothetical protein K2X86_02835 [Cytophagaceae bacterium]|nr:hypothetical protein [Cytophagaceae bacterium]
MALTMFSSCKKDKKEEPAPTPAVPTIGASLTFQSTTITLSATSMIMFGFYTQMGVSASSDVGLSTVFVAGKPSTSYTFNVATSANEGITLTDAAGEDWTAITGTATVTYNQGYITTTFSNMTFEQDSNTANTATASGTITTN